MRRVLLQSVIGQRLVGTMHAPVTKPASKPVMGVLLLNAGPLPRSWNSDLSCQLGDLLSDAGIPTFRFDLPGLGDSAGATPVLVEEFRRDISAGCYDEIIIALGRQLTSNFGLQGLIVGGLCAGAIESLRVTMLEPGLFRGLLMLEPDFRVQTESASRKPAAGTSASPRGHGIRVHLRRSLGRTRIEQSRLLRPLRGPLVSAITLMKRGTPPEGTDLSLVAAWRQVLKAGTPTLLLRAEQGVDWRTRRVLQSLPPRSVFRSVCSVLVPSTNHVFTSGTGQDSAAGEVLKWVREFMDEALGKRSQRGGGRARLPRGRRGK